MFFVVWIGATLFIDAWICRDRRPDLLERLRPNQPSAADESEV